MLMPSIFNRNFVDNFFDDDVRFPFAFPVMGNQVMKTDVKELDDHFELSIDLPGFTKDDVKAELKDGYMIISAEKSENTDEKDDKGNYIRRERHFGSCQRSFAVGNAVTEEDIKAEFEDGVLHIHVNKKEEKPAVEEKKYIAIEG